jgi:protocatechuate 3,4-dioxygenase beta subunit
MTNECTTSQLTRRSLLRRAGAVGVAAAAGGSLAGVRGLAVPDADATTFAAKLALTPEQEEGPFYVALEKIRKNITLGRPGIPLNLQLKVLNTSGKPIKAAACDIWQCDAGGVYSDESSEGTVGQTWLRGVQLTNAKGLAQFVTIYPGHYQGRTTHIHVKVHIGGKVSGSAYSGGHVSHTGQLLFDDAVTTEVYKLASYTSETAPRVYNTADHVYEEQGGAKAMLTLSKLGAGVSDGFLGAIRLVVNPAATPAGVGVGGGRP